MSKKQLTKAYIIQSLFILMKTKDYTDITIQDITNKAGVNRSTYYRNFSCKENIIETFFNKIMDDYLEEAETYEYKFEFDGESFVFKEIKKINT